MVVLSIFTTICCIDCENLHNGSDGAHTDNYEILGLSLHERQEISDPIFMSKSFQFKRSKRPLTRYSTPRTQIPQDKWQEIATKNASGESLRQLAQVYGVSHEAIRQVIVKVQAQ